MTNFAHCEEIIQLKKRTMNKLLFLVLLALMSTPCLLAQQAGGDTPSPDNPSLVVWQKDGSKVLFNLGERPKITYEGDTVAIAAATTVRYAFQAIRKMTYGVSTPDRIAAVTTKKAKPFTSHSGDVTFLSSDEDMHVKVILLSGMVVKEFVVRSGETSTMHLGLPPSNIYIICVNGVNYKIQLR